MKTIDHLISEVILLKSNNIYTSNWVLRWYYVLKYDGIFCLLEQKPFIKDINVLIQIYLNRRHGATKSDERISSTLKRHRSKLWKCTLMQTICQKLSSHFGFYVIRFCIWWKLWFGHHRSSKEIGLLVYILLNISS